MSETTMLHDTSWPAPLLEAHPYDMASRAEWLSLRQGLDTIGGSDMGAIMGLNRYVSPRVLFYRMAGIAPPRAHEDRVHLSLGHLMEKGIAAAWRCYDDDEAAMAERIMHLAYGTRDDRMGSCRPYPRILVNPDHPWLHATIDFRITYVPAATRHWLDADIHDGILECKNISARVSDMYTDGIPPYYTPQVLTYMAVTGAQYAEIAAIVGGSRLIVKPFVRDDCEDDIRRVIDMSAEFFYAAQRAREAVLNTGLDYYQMWVDGALTDMGELAVALVDQYVPGWVDDTTDEYLRFVTERHLLHLDIAAEADDDDEAAVLAQRIYELGQAVSERKQLQARLKALMTDRGLSVINTPSWRITWNKSLRITKRKDNE